MIFPPQATPMMSSSAPLVATVNTTLYATSSPIHNYSVHTLQQRVNHNTMATIDELASSRNWFRGDSKLPFTAVVDGYLSDSLDLPTAVTKIVQPVNERYTSGDQGMYTVYRIQAKRQTERGRGRELTNKQTRHGIPPLGPLVHDPTRRKEKLPLNINPHNKHHRRPSPRSKPKPLAPLPRPPETPLPPRSPKDEYRTDPPGRQDPRRLGVPRRRQGLVRALALRACDARGPQ